MCREGCRFDELSITRYLRKVGLDSIARPDIALTTPAIPVTVSFKLCGHRWRVQRGAVSFLDLAGGIFPLGFRVPLR